MKNIINSYKALSFLYTHIKLNVISIEKCLLEKNQLNQIKFDDEFYNQNTFSNYIRTQLSNLSIIQFCSFLDEYENFNITITQNEDLRKRINAVRKKNKYGLKKISEWKDIYDFRNQLLAHNFKIKNKSFFDNEENRVYTYNIPDTLNEKLLFIYIIEKICKNILKEFPEIIENSNISTYKMGNNIKIIKNIIDLDSENSLIDKFM